MTRRTGGTPLPHFFEEWPEPAVDSSDPPSADARVVVEVLSSIHRGSAEEVYLEVFVESSIPLKAFSLVLGADALDMRPTGTEDPDAGGQDCELVSRDDPEGQDLAHSVLVPVNEAGDGDVHSGSDVREGLLHAIATRRRRGSG